MNTKNIKTAFLLLAFVFAGFFTYSQNPAYNQLVSIIADKAPNTDISNKVIAFVSWSASDMQSREVNKEFDRVGTIYQVAKLKNGNKGTVVISCNIDNGSVEAIAENKDGISFSLKINKSEFSFLSNVGSNKNIVYDNTGTKVFENLGKEQIFTSYNSLITR